MSAIVTLNIFSGRPNPQWILDDAATAELRERITFRPTVTAAAPPGSIRGLGYRGIEVRFAGVRRMKKLALVPDGLPFRLNLVERVWFAAVATHYR